MSPIEYLRALRLQMIQDLKVLRDGRALTFELVNGDRRDTTAETIDENLRHITEIEQLLSEAGECFE